MGVIQVKPCRHGKMMYYLNDRYIGRSFEHYGEYSEDEIRLWSQLIKPGWSVVDCGSNIGAHTVWFSKAVGPKGRVFAIEAQRQLYQMMCGNLALNEIFNVAVINAAIGPSNGVAHLPKVDYDKTENFGGIAIGTQGDGESVPMIALDTMNIGRFHFVKIDVEGMELDVIRGGKNSIAEFKPLLYVENDRPKNSAALIESIMQLDYRCFWHLPKLHGEKAFEGPKANIFPGEVGVNMLCVHASLKPNILGLKEVRTPEDTSGVVLERPVAA